MYVFVCIFRYVCIYVCVCAFIDMCEHVCGCVHMYVNMCICRYRCVSIHSLHSIACIYSLKFSVDRPIYVLDVFF